MEKVLGPQVGAYLKALHERHGVAVDEQAHIFERGVTTKGQGRRGVGLSLVRQRLEELGGQIMVSRGHLGGALFTVVIPKEPR